MAVPTVSTAAVIPAAGLPFSARRAPQSGVLGGEASRGTAVTVSLGRGALQAVSADGAIEALAAIFDSPAFLLLSRRPSPFHTEAGLTLDQDAGSAAPVEVARALPARGGEATARAAVTPGLSAFFTSGNAVQLAAVYAAIQGLGAPEYRPAGAPRIDLYA